MKRAVALLSLAAVLLVGCKSTGDSTSTSSTAPASTEPGQGVTADSIKIGVTYTDLSSLRDLMNLDHGDYQSAFQAVADQINANGGINGRKLQLVDTPVSPIGTDAGTTACVKLAEDQKVFAVVGNIQTNVVPCYVKDHDTAVVGGYMTGEALSAAKAPWFTWYATWERLATKTIEGAAAQGAFTGKKVAVISSTADAPTVDAAVKPALAAANVQNVDYAVIDTPDNDANAAAAAAQTIAEKFKSEGVEVVISVNQTFSSWATGLAKTNFRPRNIATDQNTVAAWKVAKSPEDLQLLDGIITGAAAPASVWWNEPKFVACRNSILKAQPDRQVQDPTTATPSDRETFVSVLVACQSMTLFQAIAEKAGSTLNNDTFLQAGHDLGVFQVPAVGTTSDYTPDQPSGNPPVYLATYNPDTQRLESNTTPVP